MIELTNALKATLYERAKKPFTGTFALTWIVINWRIVFTILFVDSKNLKGLTKIEHIEQCYINLADNLGYPLLWTLGLTLFLPILNLAALWIKKWFEKIEFNKILKKEPIDGKQFGDLLEKYDDQEKHFTGKIKSLNDRNKASKAEFDTSKIKIVELNNKIIGLENEFKEKEYENKKLVKTKNELHKSNSTLTDQQSKSKLLINNLSVYIKGYKLSVDRLLTQYENIESKNISNSAKSFRGSLKRLEKNFPGIVNYI